MAKVLVVDDSRLTRRLLTGALKKAGHECVEACNGEEGLQAFHAESPDCVLSDLLMPVMDGFGFATAIREIDQDIPLLIATADIQSSSRERCETIGVTQLLNKPLSGEAVNEAVSEALASTAEGSVAPQTVEA